MMEAYDWVKELIIYNMEMGIVKAYLVLMQKTGIIRVAAKQQQLAPQFPPFLEYLLWAYEI